MTEFNYHVIKLLSKKGIRIDKVDKLDFNGVKIIYLRCFSR